MKDAITQQLSQRYTSLLTVNDLCLVGVEGPYKGERFALESEYLLVGRGDWCHLALPKDARISTRHCECWLEEEGLRVRDLESRNGIWLQGVRVKEAYLGPGQKIKVGDSAFVLQVEPELREIPRHATDASGQLIGIAPGMRRLFSLMERVAKRDSHVLLIGETGTGKSHVAHAIHMQSTRRDGPFVTVNCGALPASLIEGQLFGYEKGAFTGALQRHQGFFAQARGGTLFLDEIAELPLELQPKLLDVLERRKLRPLGSEREVDADVRLITATCRDLTQLVQAGRFREDLYFRIAVIPLTVPPLRERKEDLPLLLELILQTLSPERPITLHADVLGDLQRYPWPGNVRELRNVLERALVLLDGHFLRQEDLELPTFPKASSMSVAQAFAEREAPLDSMMPGDSSASTAPIDSTNSVDLVSCDAFAFPQLPDSLMQVPIDMKSFLAQVEKGLVQKALQETGYAVANASYALGITPTWLYNRIRKYQLQRPSDAKE